MNGDMKTAVYYRNHDIRLETRSVPDLGPRDILVQTRACGLCGGETMEWYQIHRAPKVLGHEPTGVIVEVGPQVSGFSVGDRIFAHHHVGCMSCHFCNRGHFTLCTEYNRSKIDPGGFSEFFRVPEPNLQFDTYHLPECVSFEAGTLIEPMACAMKGLRMCPIHPGDTVVVVGSGFIGMCYIALLSLTPAARIIALDLNAWRLERALEFGATDSMNPVDGNVIGQVREMNNGLLADLVVVTAPSVAAWELGYSLCERGATLHSAAPGHPDDRVEISPNELFFREIRVNATYSATHIDTRAVLDLLTSGRVRPEPFITHRFGLDGVGEAVRLLLEAGESLKSVIIP